MHFYFKILRSRVLYAVADPENFGEGGFEAQNLKISDVFTKIESDSLAEIGNSNVFFRPKSGGLQKKKGLHQNREWFFGRNRKIKRFFRPKSGGLQKKKKKVFTKI